MAINHINDLLQDGRNNNDRPNRAGQSLFLPLHYMHLVSWPTPVTQVKSCQGKEPGMFDLQSKDHLGGGMWQSYLLV